MHILVVVVGSKTETLSLKAKQKNQEGIVDIVMSNGEVATSLSDGSYFGEICLLTNARFLCTRISPSHRP